MPFLAFSGLVNFITCTFLSFFIFIKKPKKKIYLLFYLWVAIYNFGYFFWQYSQNKFYAEIGFKILTLGYIFISISFLHFVFCLLDIEDKKKKELFIYYSINIIFFFLNLKSCIYTELEPRYGLGLWPVITPLFTVYLIFWSYQYAYGLFCLIKGLKTSVGLRREQIKYFNIATFFGFLGGGTNWPMWYGIYFPPYGMMFISFSIIIIAYAIIKHQLLDIRVAITRAGIILSIYIVMLGIPLWIGFRTNFEIYSFITLFVMATIGPFVYRFLQRKADDFLLSEQRKYQDLLYTSANTIVKLHDLSTLLQTIVKIIAEAVKIEYAVVFIEDKENSIYILKAAKGNHRFKNNHPYYREFSIPNNESVIKLIKEKDKPFISDEINNLLGITGNPVQLIIPLCFDTELTGFILLGEKLNKSFYTKEDNKAFETLANQAALAIENSLFMEDNKKIQERLFRTEKLSLLGGMAEGLAHQIRNRLTQFSIASSSIQMEVYRFFSDYKEIVEQYPDVKVFFNDLLEFNDSILRNVQRTDAVVNNFIDYALIERDENSFSEFSLRKVIDLAFKLAQIKHDDIKDIDLKIEIDEKKTIYGIMSQIQEMIYNLLDNSFEAIEEKYKYRLQEKEKKLYKPVIIFRLKETDDSYIIEASDNGVGIQEENKSKIFAPYFTTKSSFKPKPNPGIGMYIMNRIVEDVHNGKINLESEYMKGTTFYITLPKAKENFLS